MCRVVGKPWGIIGSLDHLRGECFGAEHYGDFTVLCPLIAFSQNHGSEGAIAIPVAIAIGTIGCAVESGTIL